MSYHRDRSFVVEQYASHFQMYGVSQCRELLEAANAGDIEIDKYKITLLWGLMTATARKRCDASSAK